MSDNDDEITKIEDIPEIDRSNEDETEFTDLEQMAKDLGLHSEVESQEVIDNPPDLPSNDEDDFAFTAQSDQVETEDGDNQFSSFLNDDDDFNHEEAISEDTQGSFEQEQSELTQDLNLFSEDEALENPEDSGFEDTTFGETTGEFNLDQLTAAHNEQSEFDAENDEENNTSLDLEASPSDDFNLNSDSNDLLDNLDNFDEEDSSPLPPSNKNEVQTEQNEVIQAESSPPTYEDFSDVHNFANKAQSGGLIVEGNPPFSIIIKDIKYNEDVDQIAELLISQNIISNEDLESTKQTLEHGQYLIPRLSEFMAIHICHKLRHLNIDILMGLTEEITPPRSYRSNDRGLINKKTIQNNKKYTLKNIKDLESLDVIATTLSHLDGHIIKEYIGVCTLKKTLHLESGHLRFKEEEIFQQMESKQQSKLELLRIKRENLLAGQSQLIFDEDFNSKTVAAQKQEDLYQVMIDEMKTKALKQKANALIGINFTISPVTLERLVEEGPRYEVIGTASLAWVEKEI